jgi:hypothetical protein
MTSAAAFDPVRARAISSPGLGAAFPAARPPGEPDKEAVRV